MCTVEGAVIPNHVYTSTHLCSTIRQQEKVHKIINIKDVSLECLSKHLNSVGQSLDSYIRALAVALAVRMYMKMSQTVTNLEI